MRIAQLGTFDVENYGDLLFPLLAEKRLCSRVPGLRLDAVSPVGGPPVWKECYPTIEYDFLIERLSEYDGFLVGGGNIVRVSASLLKNYREGLTPLLGYANLWAGISAELQGGTAPICWNAPGVPAALPSELRPTLRTCLDRADYLSVRDIPSRDFLQEVAPDADISVVPDPAWDVDELWPSEALAKAYRSAFEARNRAVPRRSIAVHVNARYLDPISVEKVSACLDSLCRKFDATAMLLALAPCHADDELSLRVAKKMTTAPLVIDRPTGLKEIAACIAHSDAYLGSSMHGFITASAFRVPAVIVASPRKAKFQGLISQIGMEKLLQGDWSAASQHILTLSSENVMLDV